MADDRRSAHNTLDPEQSSGFWNAYLGPCLVAHRDVLLEITKTVISQCRGLPSLAHLPLLHPSLTGYPCFSPGEGDGLQPLVQPHTAGA